MLRFTFLQPNEVPLAPEHRALYSTIRDVVKWEITDETGDYSGLLIAGEQIVGIHPPSKGFVPSANMTTKFDRLKVACVIIGAKRQSVFS